MIVSRILSWWHLKWFEIAFASYIQVFPVPTMCERNCGKILFEIFEKGNQRHKTV